jgi:lipopolysaccharide assembly LptE-like protein
VTGAQSVQVATKNRLTISVQIIFKNRLNDKASFTQTFTRFSDFDASQLLQNVEPALIDDIGNQLADDIFNKAFVNW